MRGIPCHAHHPSARPPGLHPLPAVGRSTAYGIGSWLCHAASCSCAALCHRAHRQVLPNACLNPAPSAAPSARLRMHSVHERTARTAPPHHAARGLGRVLCGLLQPPALVVAGLCCLGGSSRCLHAARARGGARVHAMHACARSCGVHEAAQIPCAAVRRFESAQLLDERAQLLPDSQVILRAPLHPAACWLVHQQQQQGWQGWQEQLSW